MESSQELNSEVSPPILPVTEGPASWTTSQGDDGGMGLDDGDMQDSDDPDTTDNFDQELDEQDQDHVTYLLVFFFVLHIEPNRLTEREAGCRMQIVRPCTKTIQAYQNIVVSPDFYLDRRMTWKQR